ncbi:MAG: hypothetical protein K5841_03360 [Fretibacterium sp.]|nr:hypothetical protein [Fretibacterium sp.]
MQYEYHVDYIHISHTAPEEIKKKLNEYGERGWEIINVLFLGRQVNFPYQIIMKRLLEDQKGAAPEPEPDPELKPEFGSEMSRAAS